jgi:cytochrome c biogenesis protein CcmG/thiol:disulfide interchange protein DsbE
VKIWRLIPFILFTLLVVFFWKGLSLTPQALPSVQLGKPLPPFQLPTLAGKQSFTPQLFKHQVSLLNVWASWCPACIQEQVFLMDLSQRGIAIYGLDYKDNKDNAQRWLNEWGNPYRVIGEDVSGKVAIDLGVYGAPETFLIDKKGIIRYRHVGILDEKAWKNNFLPLIKKLEKA